MPEGHTLHRLARRQQRLFGGRRVRVSSPQGRFADGAAAVDGMTFHAAEAWGKHLLHRYRDGRTERMVHIHLGLYGAFTELTAPLPEPVGQVRLRIESEETGTDLRGPTACELYHLTDLDALIARLGPDPLRRDADPERAWAAISRSSRPIGALLMDQKVIAGIGNVYRAEVLYRAGIDPMRPGNRLLRSEFDEMWHDLVALMKVGVRRGRIHVVRPEDDHGAPAYAANRPRTYVYRRAGEPCRICGTPVLLAELDARKLYWCPVCQT
ncbi:Fpg/Nei family DNA glycosylase [Gordonia sp. YY1]|uniref:Fpg/Nei family DNA glycosylase n=1 Tax=Gordonia sp. YY1 TaxID=396712 RepID=UPI001331630D|nr:DNA-formamidopyrimidine glycosylase family protein [Gordonia sp. YY1]KAF0970589.1 Endonuclease 8 1 [Gordonia sp. YY1]